MKKILICVVCILLSALFIAAMPMEGEEKLYDNVIRLHVLANSDSEEDQALKLKVRDAILKEYSDVLSSAETIDTAKEKVEVLLSNIKDTATKTLAEEGCDYHVEVLLGEEYYPKREYDNFHFPAGNYISLRIVIGEGEGKNWWCVLFPPLCLSTAYGDSVVQNEESIPVGLSPEQYKIITKSDDVKYVVKFKVLEILEGIFEK